MVNGQTLDPASPRLTLSERWAQSVALFNCGLIASLVTLIVGTALVIEVRSAVLAVGFALVELLYWERRGFRRLLARRDAQIEELRLASRNA